MNQTQKFIGLLAILPLALVTLNPNLVGYADADMADDAIAKLETAKDELNKDTPDSQAAAGNIEGAIGDIEAAINEGLDPIVGAELMGALVDVVKQMADDAIDDAIARGADVATANNKFSEGVTAEGVEDFKTAASKYKDTLAAAEGA